MKNLLQVIFLICCETTLFAQTPNPPNIVVSSLQSGGVLIHLSPNGVVISMDAYFSVKNSGGSGEINVAVSTGQYTENKQFTVQSNARYSLISICPVRARSGSRQDLYISATFPGAPVLKLTYTVFAIQTSSYPIPTWTSYYATDTASSTLVLLDTITGIENNQSMTPKEFVLQQNYPNPFNPSTSISFSLPKQFFVTLSIFNMIGKEVATIVSEELPAGNYSRQWNATNMPSGIYFYRLQAGSFTDTKKLILLK